MARPFLKYLRKPLRFMSCPPVTRLTRPRPLQRPARLLDLARPGDGQGPGRHIGGDGRAGGDVSAPPDLDRGDELRPRAYEGPRADAGGIFRHAVIVAGDRAGADVSLIHI